MPDVFISYRRHDAAAEAGRLRAVLSDDLAGSVIFLDTTSIEPGAVWPARLREALDKVAVVLVVIGPEWIRSADEWGQRYIDRPADWVRREVEIALELGKAVIPLLVRGARLPPPDRLPPTIAKLADRQAVELRDAYFDHDLQLVVSQIRFLDGHLDGTRHIGPYPVAPPEVPDPLSDEKLETALNGALYRWQLVRSTLPEDASKTRIEIVREFRFRSFREAISFMYEVAPGCDIAIHHPRWENLWRAVRVYLTTWDIGHRISDRDIQLAKYLDHAYDHFPGADPLIHLGQSDRGT